MAPIVEYTDQKPSRDRSPHQIISPSRSSACCFSEMEWLGVPQTDGRCMVQYRRCRQCGYAVRVILRENPETILVDGLRVG
ncbi:MAG TPA: hypothetical protein VLM91_17180 [Candidatus Methylomirabilis sp.]|nr:hypothetical protein [Candidatus Methylomirabilis sp.]